MREKKESYVIITPKNDGATKKMDYHGDRWILRAEVPTTRFSREPGPWLVLISRDGKKCIHVKKTDDPDFSVRDM